MKRTEPGAPKRLVIEVGPWTSYGFGKADISRMDRRIRDGIDAAVRQYMSVGRRSKVVATRMEDA